jgi:hypothetical protein
MNDDDMMKKWNTTGLIAFGLTLATAIGLFAMGERMEGGLALAAALCVLVPQPLERDR